MPDAVRLSDATRSVTVLLGRRHRGTERETDAGSHDHSQNETNEPEVAIVGVSVLRFRSFV